MIHIFKEPTTRRLANVASLFTSVHFVYSWLDVLHVVKSTHT